MPNEDFNSEPIKCPKCNSEDLNVGELQSDINIVWREVDCDECSASWKENYVFSNWEYV